MLDTRKIGAYISKLRKDQDMTQMELAEKLNVSHQAVSKWERGESLPDISMIPLIASHYGITIDLLMNAGETNEPSHVSKIVAELSDNGTRKVAELINTGEVDMKELAMVAPIMKVSTLNKVSEDLDVKRVDKAVLSSLAPFLGSEALSAIVRQSMKDSMDWKVISEIAPFLSQDLLFELAEKTMDEGSVEVRQL